MKNISDFSPSHQNGHKPDLQVLAQPPHSDESEQATLGAMLLDSKAVAYVASTLQQSNFYRRNHRVIFGAIMAVNNAGTPIDLISVVEELRRHDDLDESGGAAYLGALIEACASAANVTSYAQTIKEKALRREAMHAAREVQVLAELPSATPAQINAALQVLARTLENSAVANKSRFSFHSIEAIEAQAPRPMRVENVLPADVLAAIVGPYGSFKSFIALDIALSVATGRAWQGLEVEAAPVVYIAAEGSGGIGKRTRAWRIRHKCDRPANFHFLTEAIQLMDEAEAATLARELALLPAKPGLIVIDTLARSMAGGDENATRDMSQCVAAADMIRRATGATVLIIHHTGKDGTLRGNTALPAALDTIIEVTAKESHATLKCAKQKDSEAFVPFSLVKRVVEIGQTDAQGRELTSLVFDVAAAGEIPTEANRSAKEEIALQVLADLGGATAKEWADACAKLGVKDRSFFNARKALVGKEVEAPEEKQGGIYRLKTTATTANAVVLQ